MQIAILNSYLYHEITEAHGRDRIVWGGAERYLAELCRLFKDLGHEVAIYAPAPNKVKQQVTKEFAGFPAILLPSGEQYWRYSTNPDLNATFNEIAKYYDLAVYFATFLCFPKVVHPSISISHGIFWDFPQGQYALLDRNEREEFFRRQLYGFTAPDICVAVDSNVRKTLMAISPGAESRVFIVYNFVDTEKFRPIEKTWDGIRVLYPRRLTMIRGCNDFIRASQKYPEYEYLAVGQASNEKLEKDTASWGDTTPQIRFIHRRMEQMPEIYQQADIAVIPSTASEGLSLSLLEAMACGLPVITTPVGGLGDAVIDGYNAIIYDPEHENLGEIIDFLAKNEEIRRKMGQRSREIAQECFDISIWRTKWKNLLGRFV